MYTKVYFFLWCLLLIIPIPYPALRLIIQNEGEVNYDELVVDEKGDDSVKDKNNKTKTPAIGTATFQVSKQEEETPDDFYMAQHGIKLEDLMSMSSQIENFIMNEIHSRINSNASSESMALQSNYSHISLEADDILSEDRLKALGHRL